MDSSNPCCAQWKSKYEKMEEKRRMFRETITFLDGKVKSLLKDNEDLKRAYDEQQRRSNVLEAEKEKEVSVKCSMEKEISVLKSEICSIKSNVACKSENSNNDARLLQTCISEKELEIGHLRHLLAEEKTRSDAEKEAADLERKKAAKLQNALCNEKSRADEANKLADASERKAEESRLELESLRNEVKSLSLKLEEVNRKLEVEKKRTSRAKKCVDEEKARYIDLERTAEANEKRLSEELGRANDLSVKLGEERQKADELQKELQLMISSHKRPDLSSQLEELSKNLEAEKKKVLVERKRAELEISSKEEQKKIAEANIRKAMEYKCHADKLSEDLESSRQRVESLEKELNQVNCILESERKALTREKKNVDTLKLKSEEQKTVAEDNIRKAVEERCRADKLSQDLQHSRHRVEILEVELNKVSNTLEVERKVLAEEKKYVETLKLKSEEHEKLAIENEVRAMEEKRRGDTLVQELDDARQKLNSMEHELCEIKQSKGLSGVSSAPPKRALEQQISKYNLLREHLKLEKKRVKYFEQVAELEKERNSMLQHELHGSKRDCQRMVQHLDMLSDTFGAKYHANNLAKRPRLSNVECTKMAERMLERSPSSQMDVCCDADVRTSSLSSRDVSCQIKPTAGAAHEGRCTVSPSGMVNDLEPLLGGSRGDTLPSSALNSNTASFSDEQLMGSQERATGSLSTSAGLTVKNSNHQAIIPACNDSERAANIAENGMDFTGFYVGHAKKRRKTVDEFESIKKMHLEGKRIFQEAETKLLALHKTLVQPLVEHKEMENVLLTDGANSSGSPDMLCKKRKATDELEVVLQEKENVPLTNYNSHVCPDLSRNNGKATDELEVVLPGVDCSTVQIVMDKSKALDPASTNTWESFQPQEAAVAEEHYRSVMEMPLSPALPDLDEVEFQMRGAVLSVCNNAKDINDSTPDKNQNFCVVFADMEDVATITRIFCATRNCKDGLHLSSQTNWLVKDMLVALQSEEALTPRERVCALFSLLLLNFSGVSCTKNMDLQSQELLDSFTSEIQSVLLNVETQDLFMKICDLMDLLQLCEDFLLNKGILLQNCSISGPLNDGDSFKEILLEGNICVLYPKMASTSFLVAGCAVMASISVVVGDVGSVCEASLKIISMSTVDCSLALLILHMFAYICGEEYFNCSSYYSAMKVVEYFVMTAEGSLGNKCTKANQPRDGTWPHFSPCDKCPFSETPVCLDDVSSELLEELQRLQTSPKVADSYSSNVESLSGFVDVVLLSLELIAAKMSWDWVCSKIVPQLSKLLESCNKENIVSTAIVVLLGDLGRLGVKVGGYDDAGVKSIGQLLSHILLQTSISKCNSFSIAAVQALVGLHPEGKSIFHKNTAEFFTKLGLPTSAASNARDILSLVSRKHSAAA